MRSVPVLLLALPACVIATNAAKRRVAGAMPCDFDRIRLPLDEVEESGMQRSVYIAYCGSTPYRCEEKSTGNVWNPYKPKLKTTCEPKNKPRTAERPEPPTRQSKGAIAARSLFVRLADLEVDEVARAFHSLDPVDQALFLSEWRSMAERRPSPKASTVLTRIDDSETKRPSGGNRVVTATTTSTGASSRRQPFEPG